MKNKPRVSKCTRNSADAEQKTVVVKNRITGGKSSIALSELDRCNSAREFKEKLLTLLSMDKNENVEVQFSLVGGNSHCAILCT